MKRKTSKAPRPALEALGRLLLRLRLDRRMGQVEVQQAAAVCRMSPLETGTERPKAATLLRLLDALGAPPADRREACLLWAADQSPAVVAEALGVEPSADGLVVAERIREALSVRAS